MSRAKCIMVQGTMSGAGKKPAVRGALPHFAQDGYKTAPFKSQNMALNSFVTRTASKWAAHRSCRRRPRASSPMCG